MSRGLSRPQIIGSIGIALGVIAMLAYPVIWNVLIHWKWLEESLHPDVILDPVNPIWLLIVGILLIALGFREMAKRETPSHRASTCFELTMNPRSEECQGQTINEDSPQSSM